MASAPASASFVGPSGLEVESEQETRILLENQRLAAEAAAVEVARLAAEAAAAEEGRLAAEAAAQAAAEEAAAAEAEEAQPPTDSRYAPDDLEWACSEGIATIEECFGPASDANGHGIADINEWAQPITSRTLRS